MKDIKRSRKPENPNLEQFVLKWSKLIRDNKIPLNGSLVRVKTKQFVHESGLGDFRASTEWLDGFKDQNITFKDVCGESGAVYMWGC